MTPVVRRACPRAVLFDRDGTLCVDVPYNGNPNRVVPVPGAAGALARLRDAGVHLAVISNQSGIARGRHTPADVDAVNARLAELVGPIGPVFYCPHGPDDACRCRKPQPGLVLDACAALDVAPADCVVIGDIAADLGAAAAAGARAILVPTEMTRREEIEAARRDAWVAPDLTSAVALVLGGVLPAGTSEASVTGAAA